MNSETRSVVLIGNSHSRGCTSKIKETLSKNFEVVDYVKPRANNSFLTNTANNFTKKLKNNDIVIYWEGTSDINHHDTNNGLRSVLDFVKRHKHTNTPLRHDFKEWSCVNVERENYIIGN